MKTIRTTAALALLIAALPLNACGGTLMMLHGNAVRRPAPSEFGLGPRLSATGLYVVTLEPASPLRPRQMQTLRVILRHSDGWPLDDAEIAVSGGMPQHGHGLPTRPRVTRSLGDGNYELEGVRFNMGGWWELTLAISGASGTDTVTFNLAL